MFLSFFQEDLPQSAPPDLAWSPAVQERRAQVGISGAKGGISGGRVRRMVMYNANSNLIRIFFILFYEIIGRRRQVSRNSTTTSSSGYQKFQVVFGRETAFSSIF